MRRKSRTFDYTCASTFQQLGTESRFLSLGFSLRTLDYKAFMLVGIWFFLVGILCFFPCHFLALLSSRLALSDVATDLIHFALRDFH